MAYSVDNIIPVNVLLTASGLGYANFSTAFAFADVDDLAAGATFSAGAYRDYETLADVADDFGTVGDIYQIAARWFANVPRPRSLSVWMKAAGSTPVEAASASSQRAWRYHQFFKNEDLSESNAVALADWADANNRALWLTLSAPGVIDAQSTTDLGAVMRAKGSRHVFAGYKTASSIATDPSQGYAMVQLAAAFNKFRPLGLRTAITGEYQVLPGVTGDSLSPSAYNALKAKNVAFITPIELAGEVDNSRVINSKSMSSYGEFIDDVINVDVLRNHLQVDGYNYIAGAASKRALDEQGYSGLLDACAQVGKRFFDNGVLGAGTYVDPRDGETKTAEFGYAILSSPEDVYALTQAQKRARQFPPVTMIVILSRAGHTAEINVSVE